MPLIREVLSPPGLKQLIEPLDFTPETDLESSMASLLSEKERRGHLRASNRFSQGFWQRLRWTSKRSSLNEILS